MQSPILYLSRFIITQQGRLLPSASICHGTGRHAWEGVDTLPSRRHPGPDRDRDARQDRPHPSAPSRRPLAGSAQRDQRWLQLRPAGRPVRTALLPNQQRHGTLPRYPAPPPRNRRTGSSSTHGSSETSRSDATGSSSTPNSWKSSSAMNPRRVRSSPLSSSSRPHRGQLS